jgi:hypothetical protein
MTSQIAKPSGIIQSGLDADYSARFTRLRMLRPTFPISEKSSRLGAGLLFLEEVLFEREDHFVDFFGEVERFFAGFFPISEKCWRLLRLGLFLDFDFLLELEVERDFVVLRIGWVSFEMMCVANCGPLLPRLSDSGSFLDSSYQKEASHAGG